MNLEVLAAAAAVHPPALQAYLSHDSELARELLEGALEDGAIREACYQASTGWQGLAAGRDPDETRACEVIAELPGPSVQIALEACRYRGARTEVGITRLIEVASAEEVCDALRRAPREIVAALGARAVAAHIERAGSGEEYCEEVYRACISHRVAHAYAKLCPVEAWQPHWQYAHTRTLLRRQSALIVAATAAGGPAPAIEVEWAEAPRAQELGGELGAAIVQEVCVHPEATSAPRWLGRGQLRLQEWAASLLAQLPSRTVMAVVELVEEMCEAEELDEETRRAATQVARLVRVSVQGRSAEERAAAHPSVTEALDALGCASVGEAVALILAQPSQYAERAAALCAHHEEWSEVAALLAHCDEQVLDSYANEIEASEAGDARFVLLASAKPYICDSGDLRGRRDPASCAQEVLRALLAPSWSGERGQWWQHGIESCVGYLSDAELPIELDALPWSGSYPRAVTQMIAQRTVAALGETAAHWEILAGLDHENARVGEVLEATLALAHIEGGQ